jgi:hypothetical protein
MGPYADAEALSMESLMADFRLNFYSKTKHDIEREFQSGRNANSDNSEHFNEALVKSLFQSMETACSSSAFQAYADRWGLGGASFEPNRSFERGVLERFAAAFRALPGEAQLALVFHGTREENIPAILRDSLDPKRRSGQAYGPGK